MCVVVVYHNVTEQLIWSLPVLLSICLWLPRSQIIPSGYRRICQWASIKQYTDTWQSIDGHVFIHAPHGHNIPPNCLFLWGTSSRQQWLSGIQTPAICHWYSHSSSPSPAAQHKVNTHISPSFWLLIKSNADVFISTQITRCML